MRNIVQVIWHRDIEWEGRYNALPKDDFKSTLEIDIK